jgi:hypothetical protein
MNKFIGSLLAIAIIALSGNTGCSHRPAYEPTPPDQYARYVSPPAKVPVAESPVVDNAQATPTPVTPVVEMFKGQSAQCAKEAPHSIAWEMQSCDDLERIKKGQKPANDTDDWLVKQPTSSLEAWFQKQSVNKSLAPKLIPIGRTTVLSNLRQPSKAAFTGQNIALQCPDTDTFIAVYGVEGKNVFNAEILNTFCVGISLKDSRGVIVDCGPLVNIRFALEKDDRESIVTNLRLLCELPAKLLKL